MAVPGRELRYVCVETASGLTRRTLLSTGATATLSIYLVGFDGLARAAGGTTPSYLRRSSYTAAGTRDFVAVAADGSRVTLHLAEIADLTPALAGSDDAFALAFRAAGATALPDGIVALSHPELGDFPLFLSPAGEQAYAATVDRSVTAPKRPPRAPRRPAGVTRLAASRHRKTQVVTVTAALGAEGFTEVALELYAGERLAARGEATVEARRARIGVGAIPAGSYRAVATAIDAQRGRHVTELTCSTR